MFVISIHFVGLPLATQPPTTVPGSTATTTIAPAAATHSSLPQQLAHPSTYNVAQPLVSMPESTNITPTVLPGNVLPPQQPLKVKKGVKRKADTTTHTVYDYNMPLDSKSAKISTRRESNRQVKKPIRTEMEGMVSYNPANISPMITNATSTPQHASHKPKEKLSEALKSCNEILKELFSKKHSVRTLEVIFVFLVVIIILF